MKKLSLIALCLTLTSCGWEPMSNSMEDLASFPPLFIFHDCDEMACNEKVLVDKASFIDNGDNTPIRMTFNFVHPDECQNLVKPQNVRIGFYSFISRSQFQMECVDAQNGYITFSSREAYFDTCLALPNAPAFWDSKGMMPKCAETEKKK